MSRNGCYGCLETDASGAGQSMRGAITALFVAVVLFVGCSGSGNGEVPAEPPSELARMIPDNPFGVSEVDLLALKEALGLPADADPSTPPEGEADRRLASVTRAAVPFCGLGDESPEPIDIAIGEAVDCSQVEAAAAPAGVGTWSLTIMRTAQPFEEIAASLVASGYSRQGRLLGYVGGDKPMRYLEVVASAEDDSVIALSRDATVGFAALGVTAAADARAELRALGALPAAPARTAWLGDGQCVAAHAIADRIEDERGELVVQLAADGKEVVAGGFTLTEHEGFAGDPGAAELFEFDQPEADGDTLRVSFSLREGEAREQGAIATFDALAFANPYEC